MKKLAVKSIAPLAGLFVLVAALGLFVFSSKGETTHAATTTQVTIYRLYNPGNGEHLYTQDANEKNVLSTTGWIYEGIGWYAPSAGTPVYRLYNPGLKNHLYTTDTNEVKVLTHGNGWQSDNNGKPLFYSGGTVSIYRLYNRGLAGMHLLSTDANEYKTLPSYGWSQEGIKLYAVAKGKSANLDLTKVLPGNFMVPEVYKFGSTYYMYGSGEISTSSNTTNFSAKRTLQINGSGIYSIKAGASSYNVNVSNSTNSDGWSSGIYSIHYVNGKYVGYFTIFAPSARGIAIGTATATSPDGPFTMDAKPLITIPTGTYYYYDPITYTENGKLYLLYAGGNSNGAAGINIIQLSSDGLSTVGSSSLLINKANIPNSQGIVENPSLTKSADGSYVLFYSANHGDTSNYFVGSAVSKSITGPYTDQGQFLNATNTKLAGAGEESVFVDGGNNYMYFNTWVGPHSIWDILPGGEGRAVYRTSFTWFNGHVPQLNYN
ncbi:MAG: family 43 glycosylhydrolase [Streptococcaceae bacterium]|nr:family 43 glycosylhydrolase [Streptococcaceae bacterium]